MVKIAKVYRFRVYVESGFVQILAILRRNPPLYISHVVIKGKKYYSLNSPQVKHNLSPINRTSVLGVDILVGVVDGENFDFMFLKSVISSFKCYFPVKVLFPRLREKRPRSRHT